MPSKTVWDYLRNGLAWGDDLLPVCPPGSNIHPSSKLTSLGQTPSMYTDNMAHGINGWTKLVATSAQLDEWASDRRYGICIQTRRVRAFDIDVHDLLAADDVRSWLMPYIGATSYRYRNKIGLGKCLVPFICESEVNHREVPVDGGIVELLGNGQQFVAYGKRSDGSEYVWNTVAPKGVPTLTLDQVNLVWEELVKRFATGVAKERTLSKFVTSETVLEDDPAIPLLYSKGMIKLDDGSGAYHITCPWDHEHSSDTGSSSTVYFQNGYRGQRQGFSCLHAHCLGRTAGAFEAAIGLHSQDMPTSTIVESSQSLVGSISSGMVQGRNGGIADKFTNAVQWLKDHPHVITVKYDTFKDHIYVGFQGDKALRPITDADYLRFRNLAVRSHFFDDLSSANAKDALKLTAEECKYDSAIDWITSLRWDGTPRILRFLSEYFGCENSEYSKQLGKYIWTSAAARVVRPGYKVDIVPILRGGQGIGKTTALRCMVPDQDMFVNLHMDEPEDEIARSLRGVLLAEWGEARGIKSKDKDKIKDWISNNKDKWTPKYCEYSTTYLRRSITVATTNTLKLLVDPTGNRRFAPIEVVDKVNTDRVEKDRDQLWAEGLAMFESDGKTPWYEVESICRKDGRHEQVFRDDVWETTVIDFLKENPGVSNTLVLTMGLSKEIKDCSNFDLERIDAIRSRLGI